MSTNGQAQVIAIRRDVTGYITAMERMARAHFETGADLLVTDDIINYFSNFNRIPVPTVNIVASHVDYCGANTIFEVIGFVNCGALALTRENPFNSLNTIKNGVETTQDGNVCCRDLYYSTNQFESVTRANRSDCTSAANFHETFFAGPTWGALRAASENCRLGFFNFSVQYLSEAPLWSLGIRDASGSFVDIKNLSSIATANPACENLEAASESDLSVALISRSPTSTAGTITTYNFAVTNNGPGAAYGVSFSLPLAAGLEFVSVTASQGGGTYTNGMVHFDVGPLANGSVATIQLRLLPVVTGPFQPGTPAQVSNGPGLTETNTENNVLALAPLVIQPPRLSILKTGGQVELSWNSDTDRLMLEQTSTLRPINAWTPTTNSVAITGNRRSVRVSPAGSRKFYRLGGI